MNKQIIHERIDSLRQILTAQDLTAWEATSLHEVLAACDTFVSECLLSKPSTVSTASVSLFVSNR